MLTKRMQVQFIADRMAGLSVQADARHFTQPWLSCWNAITTAPKGQEHEALHKATEGLPDQKEILQAILGTRPGYTPSIPSLNDIGKGLPPIEWVWKGYIPRGLLTILGASQGSGKSFLGLDLAHRIIHNQGFPDGAPIARPGSNIIYVDAEAVPQILYQRAKDYGTDRDRIFPMLPEPDEAIDLNSLKYQDRLMEMTHLLKPELIIIDSLSSMHSRGQNNVEDLRALFMYLVRLAGWSGSGLMLIHHIRKTPFGQRMMNADFGMEDFMGSVIIAMMARVMLGLRVVQTGPEFDPNGPRELKVLKTNLGVVANPLGFRFEKISEDGARLRWETQPPREYHEPTQMDVCMEWLEDTLRENPGGLPPKEVLKMGMEQGFSRSMIFRTRRELSTHIENTRGRQAPDNAWRWSDISVLSDEEE